VARGFLNSDLDFHILPWYAKLQKHGPLVGLGKDFYNYTPPYVYLLALATLTSSLVAPVTAVKLIAMAFDVFAAVMVFKIVRLHRGQGFLPHLAAAAFFAAPTVVANSGVWGQADSTYTAFLLACVYFLLREWPLPAVVSFSIALAFKPQAIFLAPFLLLLALWRRIPWYQFLLVPGVYALMMAPAVALGRTWPEVLTLYTVQAGSGKGLTHNAASIYVFIPKWTFDWLFWPAVGIAILVVLGWVVHSWLHNSRRDGPALLLLSLVSVTLVPFLLPNMHDRYFFPADTLSLVLAFVTPSLWFVPILFQLLSMLSYSMYLWEGPSENLQAAALISLFTLVVLLNKQAGLRGTVGGPRPGAD
jgi:Gpi18-like mannosyltransferase